MLTLYNMNDTKTIYLLGAKTHDVAGNIEEFNNTVAAFKEHNPKLDIINPHNLSVCSDWTAVNIKSALRSCARTMLIATEVVTLKDWHTCPLACEEKQLANLLGIPVVSIFNYFK